MASKFSLSIPSSPVSTAVDPILSPRRPKAGNASTPKKEKKHHKKQHARKASVHDTVDVGFKAKKVEDELQQFLESYLNPVFQIMGVGRMHIAWDKHLYTNVSKNAYSLLVKERRARLQDQPLMSDTALNTLRMFHSQFKECLDHQERLEKIVLAQAVVRGFLVRRRLNFNTSLMGDVKRRNNVVLVLLNSERDYIAKLELISTEYLSPLRTRALSQEETMKVVDLFANIEQITSNHNELFADLDALLAEWPLVTGVGRVFLKHAKNFENYGKYAENYFTSMNTLDGLKQDKKSWVYTVIEGVPGGTASLAELLVLPLRRIEKYEVQLQNMVFDSLEDLQDNEEITRAYSIMKNISKLVSAKLEQAETTFELLQIQRMLVNESPVAVVTDTRRLHKKGQVLQTNAKANSKTKIMIFLFSDCIMLGKKLSHEKFKYLGQSDLMELDWNRHPTKEKGVFELTIGGATYQLQDKDDQWQKAIDAAIMDIKDRKSVV